MHRTAAASFRHRWAAPSLPGQRDRGNVAALKSNNATLTTADPGRRLPRVDDRRHRLEGKALRAGPVDAERLENDVIAEHFIRLAAHAGDAVLGRIAALEPPQRVVLHKRDEEWIWHTRTAGSACERCVLETFDGRHAHGSAIFGWSHDLPVQQTGWARSSHSTVFSRVSGMGVMRCWFASRGLRNLMPVGGFARRARIRASSHEVAQESLAQESLAQHGATVHRTRMMRGGRGRREDGWWRGWRCGRPAARMGERCEGGARGVAGARWRADAGAVRAFALTE